MLERLVGKIDRAWDVPFLEIFLRPYINYDFIFIAIHYLIVNGHKPALLVSEREIGATSFDAWSSDLAVVYSVCEYFHVLMPEVGQSPSCATSPSFVSGIVAKDRCVESHPQTHVVLAEGSQFRQVVLKPALKHMQAPEVLRPVEDSTLKVTLLEEFFGGLCLGAPHRMN